MSARDKKIKVNDKVGAFPGSLAWKRELVRLVEIGKGKVFTFDIGRPFEGFVAGDEVELIKGDKA